MMSRKIDGLTLLDSYGTAHESQDVRLSPQGLNQQRPGAFFNNTQNSATNEETF